MDWKQLLTSITGSVDEELRLRNAYLASENRILRHQLPGRIRLTDAERKPLAEIGQKLGRHALAEVATIAKPDTILAWHRTFVAQTRDRSQPRKALGRPRIDQELETLVVRLAHENRSWGYDRIVGALAHVGYTISDQTVGNILKRHGIPPVPERKATMTWRDFIRIHMDVLMATDFFTGEVWSWLGRVISCPLLFMHVGRRTRHGAGMMAWLQARWSLLISPPSPDGHIGAESWRRSVMKPRLSRRLQDGERVPRLLLSEFETHPHREHLPQGLGTAVLVPVIHSRPIRDGPMRCRPRLDGLLPYDHREAA
jgi:putative transposase